MSERKPFRELSQRQKRRRLADLSSDDFEESDSEKSEHTSEHDIVRDIDNETSFSLPNDVTMDFITTEFDKLISEYSSDEGLSNDSDDSDSENEKFDKKEDIKSRLVTLISDSNLPDIHSNSLLKIMRDAGLNYLPKDVRTLRKTPRQSPIINCPPGEYLHFGLEKALENTLSKIKYNSKDVLIDINIDGVPITKSPAMSLWPILGKIVDDSTKSVFVIGIYRGKEKPHSITSYLNSFIDEYIKLNENGFIFKGRRYKLKIRCLICDSPAASYVLNIKQFNGYYGCRKCVVKGDYISRKMVYLNFEADLRTNISFRARENKEHHHSGMSPFEKITNFDIVKQVPLDYMHLLCLGMTKLLIRLWINPRTEPHINIIHLDTLSSSLVSLRPWIPKEFARKPESLLELKNWKATSFRFVLLYAGPILLQNVLPIEYLKNFNDLSCASRILSSEMFCNDPEMIKYAKRLYKYYVHKFIQLYGEKWTTGTTHNVVHLADDVEEFGPVDNFSAFPYENFMQTLKRMIRKKNQPLQQIHHRLTEKSFLKHKPKNLEEDVYPKMLQPVNRTLPKGFCSSYKVLKFENFELREDRPNNCYITHEGEIVVIDRICKKHDQDVIIGRKFLIKRDIPHYPLPSTYLGICEVENLSQKHVFSVDTVENKACLFFHDKKSYVVPLFHH